MTRIALIGASGTVGSRILKELSDRGHPVSAIARHPENIPSLSGVTAVKGDLKDGPDLARLLKDSEVVVSSVRFLDTDFDGLIEAVRQSGARRWLVVGGAGSLEVAPGRRLVDEPDFPAQYKSEALRGAEFLDLLRTTDDIDWVFLSPSALFLPGERTGTYRLGTDALLTSDQGSSISIEDYAKALVDEIEAPQHARQRFTVGY